MSPRDRVLHMIGNAHIDPVWLWQWPEGYQEVRATFASAIDRMNEYPEFVFTCDSVLYLAWVEEHDPDLFAAIGRRIADGRWQQVGGWWIEPDCNLPSGESFVRQALYSQRYLRAKFGVTATVGFNVDPFGHNASLPQILRGSGMDSYVFMRPGPHEMTLPGPYFWWESPNGTRVLAYRIPHEYCSSSTDVGNQIDKSLAQLPPDVPELMVFYGVGNHGGGPTRANLDSIRRLDETGSMPHLKCGSPRDFFDRLVASGAEIPVHLGELQHHAVGCYSAHSGVKRWNRRAENLLARAEKWATVAAAVADCPAVSLERAWKLVLFNQFHDTLGGAGIEPAYEDSRDQFGHAVSLAGEVFNRAVQTIARRVDVQPEPDMTPVVVFNPHPWPLVADVEFEFGGFAAPAARAVDDHGDNVAVQRTRSKATVNGWRRRLVLAVDVPPMGYRTYRLYPSDAPPVPPPTSLTLANDFVALAIDPATGWLTSLRDKVSDVDVVGGGTHAVVIDDRSDTWGHRVRAYDRTAGVFTPSSVRLVEQGPVRSILRVVSTYESSTLVEEYVLGTRDRHVEVRVTLDWHEKQKLLKLRFPTVLSDVDATFEIPYGHLSRPANGREEVAQAWVDVTGVLPDGRHGGLAVLNDGKYGHDVLGGDIGITAARSPVYAWHEPKELDEDELYTFQDQGRQEFTYRLVPHGGDWRAASVVRLAAELNQPPFPLLESYHDGDLPQTRSFMAVSRGTVVPTVLKAAEDDPTATVVRAYESAGRPCEATIEVLGRTVTASFGPAEIRTFLVPGDPAKPVTETDLIEWQEEPAPQQARAEEPRPGAPVPQAGPEEPPHPLHAGVTATDTVQ
jgi:alpha-mannosidase